MPFLAYALYASENMGWEAYPIQTGDGYLLNIGRITSFADGSTNQGYELGPVLLLHGVYGDGLSWFGESDPSYPSLPESLYSQGYDVWIAFQRGTMSSRNHLDAAGHAARSDGTSSGQSAYESYWDFSVDDIAKYDIPAYINMIVAERQNNFLAAKKVQILTATTAVQEAVATLSLYPTTAANFISAVVNQSPCLIQDEKVTLEYFAALTTRRMEAVEDEREGRSLQQKKYRGRRLASPNKASKDKLYEHLRDMRGMMSYSDYQEFYKCYQDWRYAYGKEYKNNMNWEDPVYGCCCAQDNTQEWCQPDSQASISDLLIYLRENGIASLYGPDFDAQRDFICSATADGGLGADSSVCCYMKGVNASYPEYTGEIGLKVLDQILQSSLMGKFCKYSSTFWTDGWYTGCEEYDLSANTVPITSQLVSGNNICSETVNSSWLKKATDDYWGGFTWTDGRTHSGSNGLQGDQDDAAFFQLVGQLWHNVDITVSLAGFTPSFAWV